LIEGNRGPMAQVFPLGDHEGAHGDSGPTLAGALASLPQDWTVLLDRKLDADVVDAVLVHPERGLALVSTAPLALGAAAALRERLNDEHFEDFFPGELPIVALRITRAEILEIEQRLGSAFRHAPKLAITNRDWADAAVELLLAWNDLELTPAVTFAAALPEPVQSLGPADPETEGAAALPSFSGSRFLTSRTDHDSVPPPSPPTPHWGDRLVPVICAVVFAAELGVAFGVLGFRGLLPFSKSSGVETAALRPLEAAPKTGEPAPSPEVSPVVLAEQPLIAASAEPPILSAPPTADGVTSKYGEVLKAATSRRHRANTSRPTQTKNGGDRHAGNRRSQYALAEEIYQPGRRAPGW
jgi:hypothetical protein